MSELPGTVAIVGAGFHRHRLPQSTSNELNRLRAAGSLQVHAGQLLMCEPVDQRIHVNWRPRGSAAVLELRVHAERLARYLVARHERAIRFAATAHLHCVQAHPDPVCSDHAVSRADSVRQ